MAGNKFGFKSDHSDSTKNLQILYKSIDQNLQSLRDYYPSGYDLSEDNIVYFEIIFRWIDTKFLTDLRIDSSLLLSQEKIERSLFNKQIN